MIKVTIGESKPQNIKHYPKLMITGVGWVGYFTSYGKCTWLSGDHAGKSAENVNMEDIGDFNKPITLQNA